MCRAVHQKSSSSLFLRRKLVTALEILRLYADALANAGYNLVAIRMLQKDPSALNDPIRMHLFRVVLEKLLKDCIELPVTTVKIKRILAVLDSPEVMKIQPPESMAKMLEGIGTRLQVAGNGILKRK